MSHKAIKFDSVEAMVNHYNQSNQEAAQAVFYATDRPQPPEPQPMPILLPVQPQINDIGKVLAEVPANPGEERLPEPSAVAKAGKKVQEADLEVQRLTNVVAARNSVKNKESLKKAKSALTKALNAYNKLTTH